MVTTGGEQEKGKKGTRPGRLPQEATRYLASLQGSSVRRARSPRGWRAIVKGVRVVQGSGADQDTRVEDRLGIELECRLAHSAGRRARFCQDQESERKKETVSAAD